MTPGWGIEQTALACSKYVLQQRSPTPLLVWDRIWMQDTAAHFTTLLARRTCDGRLRNVRREDDTPDARGSWPEDADLPARRRCATAAGVRCRSRQASVQTMLGAQRMHARTHTTHGMQECLAFENAWHADNADKHCMAGKQCIAGKP
eukprot:366360-Chlamydomonas_euryale.AAC.15